LKLTAVSERFHRAAKKHGLPRLKFHGLRHTASTIMLAGGVHPRGAQERLGQTSVAMTLGRYSHVTETMQRDAADKLDALLG
jgi:integrase